MDHPPAPEFDEQDLSAARFESVNLHGASLRNVDLTGARLRSVDFSGADLRAVDLHGVRIRGAELLNVRIDAELENVVINGVDVAPLIEAELDRRDPRRALMRPSDPAGFADAWHLLERLWDETVERARTFPPEALHDSVDDEWSFIQTLRHLGFASAAWVGRMVLGNPNPWHPLDLPWDEAPGWAGIPCDRDARPALGEVLEVRRRRQDMVRDVIEGLTPVRLASTLTRAEPGWPQLENFPLKQCLLIVLNEEWHHRLFAERDLTALQVMKSPQKES
ncbi:MAG TPA: pentapeptide repeat-containing protein [Intrasporangium sp.]|nr:pentapeptide repeat-containing protein [Intrasporangium sp.]